MASIATLRLSIDTRMLTRQLRQLKVLRGLVARRSALLQVAHAAFKDAYLALQTVQKLSVRIDRAQEQLDRVECRISSGPDLRQRAGEGDRTYVRLRRGLGCGAGLSAGGHQQVLGRAKKRTARRGRTR